MSLPLKDSPGPVIRLAAVSYLNTAPLIDAIERGEVDGFSVVRDLPSRLPAMVTAGAADLGLLPAGYLARHPEMKIAPGAGIACRGPVRSILLLTEGDVRQCRRIAATTASMSSVALLALLLKHHFRSAAELVPSDAPVEAMDRGAADGALLIGDPALQADAGLRRSYDLGEEWFRFCGLPFVFAAWAGPDPETVERAAPGLVKAMKLGRAVIPRIAAEAAGRLGLPAGLCEDYLANYIIHDVTDAEMAGYDRFRALLQAHDSGR